MVYQASQSSTVCQTETGTRVPQQLHMLILTRFNHRQLSCKKSFSHIRLNMVFFFYQHNFPPGCNVIQEVLKNKFCKDAIIKLGPSLYQCIFFFPPPQVQQAALPFAELHEVPLCPFLQTVSCLYSERLTTVPSCRSGRK